MVDDFLQWQRQKRQLQEELAIARREGEAAAHREANWRQLYETEAEQRRADAAIAQTRIAALEAKLEAFQHPQVASELSPTHRQALEADLACLSDLPADLQAKLAAMLKERQQLLQALQAERESHARTRRTLTTALGDTISTLHRRRWTPTGPRRSQP